MCLNRCTSSKEGAHKVNGLANNIPERCLVLRQPTFRYALKILDQSLPDACLTLPVSLDAIESAVVLTVLMIDEKCGRPI